jgi:tight adherence protein B
VIGALAAQTLASADVLVRMGMMLLIGVAVALFAMSCWGPARQFIARRERHYDAVLRGSLLLDVSPRTVTLLGLGAIPLIGLIAYSIVQHPIAVILGVIAGALLPSVVLKVLKARRKYRLEDQLVDGIQTLSSGVRAGLNLIQAMDLLAKNGVRPVSEEFAHLLREYEYGVPVERAMLNAADRIGSSNYRLLFSALLTHRERGGDLGETLDRIADSIREIHRLEKRIETLTAPGRTAARWMGAMPIVILIMMRFIDRPGVSMLFTEDIGKLILAVIVLLNVVGFLWIRKIVSIDV